MKTKQTVAGRLGNGQIFYATFSSTDDAKRALNMLRHGYRAVDGLTVETIGVVDDSLHAAIHTQWRIQESFHEAQKSLVRKLRAAKRFWQ
jgi:hypothetical protein